MHRVVSLLKRWILGTHQGAVSHEHLDYYLDEFTFRFNRRKSRSRGKLFYRLVQQAVAVQPAPYKSLVGGTATRATDNHNSRGHFKIPESSEYPSGANVNARSTQGTTALMNASQDPQLDVVKYLVMNEASVNLQNVDGWTALMTAAFRGHTEVVRYLLKHAASVKLTNNQGKTALDLARTSEIRDLLTVPEAPKVPRLVYDICDYYFLFLQPLNAAEREGLRNWLKKLDTSRLPNGVPSTDYLESFHRMFLNSFEYPGGGASGILQQSRELQGHLRNVLASFGLNGRKARKAGYFAMAPRLEAYLADQKDLFLAELRVRPPRGVRPAARVLVEYFAVYDGITIPEERPIRPSAALLSIDDELSRKFGAQRLTFGALHRSLWSLAAYMIQVTPPSSLGTPRKERPPAGGRSRAVEVEFVSLLQTIRVSDSEIRAAGGEQYLGAIHRLRSELGRQLLERRR